VSRVKLLSFSSQNVIIIKSNMRNGYMDDSANRAAGAVELAEAEPSVGEVSAARTTT
jgi:hypothetical protein